ncbi:MAG: methyltransferase domain-containing protein [candidate division WOR-3 bacterium]|nr:methyltransferase domain-containing protein [candidate division WOR-3 bacterium]MCX7837666.1 methyltransferase domain-containing protein [candidate division WOR-3 bacterium]MDW8113609.1 methyltransferase domain-containing protein [candidate division WOR-3 bacterium]
MIRRDFTIKDVQEVYQGVGGKLWELVMGEQIHSGGERATDILAQALELKPGMLVLDICSALGGPARQLAKKYGVKVIGLDATPRMVEEAIKRTEKEGLSNLVEYVLGNALDLPFKKETFDVVWGQEAWCYITDKRRLINEAYRVLKPKGKIGFTDWIITGEPSPSELQELLDSMTFPYMETFEGYQKLLKEAGFEILIARDETEDFHNYFIEYQQKVTGELKDVILNEFGKDIYDFAYYLVNLWEKASREHKVGRGFYVAIKK